MGWGVPLTIPAVFDAYPIGTVLRIGTDSGWWHGPFGGIQDGVAIMTNAHFHNNTGAIVIGTALGLPGSIPVVRIPIRDITFVSL